MDKNDAENVMARIADVNLMHDCLPPSDGGRNVFSVERREILRLQSLDRYRELGRG